MDKYSVTCEPGDIERHRPIATLAYLPFLCFVTFALGRRSKFALYHANQGLVLLIVAGVLGALMTYLELEVLVFHPHGAPIAVILWLGFLSILASYIGIGLQYAFRGVCEPLPLIGKWRLIPWD